jgi:hypothetical protein
MFIGFAFDFFARGFMRTFIPSFLTPDVPPMEKKKLVATISNRHEIRQNQNPSVDHKLASCCSFETKKDGKKSATNKKSFSLPVSCCWYCTFSGAHEAR